MARFSFAADPAALAILLELAQARLPGLGRVRRLELQPGQVSVWVRFPFRDAEARLTLTAAGGALTVRLGSIHVLGLPVSPALLRSMVPPLRALEATPLRLPGQRFTRAEVRAGALLFELSKET